MHIIVILISWSNWLYYNTLSAINFENFTDVATTDTLWVNSTDVLVSVTKYWSEHTAQAFINGGIICTSSTNFVISRFLWETAKYSSNKVC